MGFRVRFTVIFVASALTLWGCKHGNVEESAEPTITATLDMEHGAEHSATWAISRPSSLTCVAVSLPDGACYVASPGYTGMLTQGESAHTDESGLLTLDCSGNDKPMTCTLKIQPQ